MCAQSNGRLYDFNGFTRIKDLGNYIYSVRISIKQAKNEQNTMEQLIANLYRYKPKKESIKESRNDTLNNAKKFFNLREMFIKAFEDSVFPLSTKSQRKKAA